MPQRFDPKFDVLPAAQQQIWNALAAAPRLGFVLYGGTAIALHLGHRRSIDFDFFRSEPLDKNQLRAKFAFVKGAAVLQDTPDTQVILAEMPAGSVKISFFGNIGFGRVREPLQTRDGVLLVASLDDGDQAKSDIGSGRGKRLSRHRRDDLSWGVIVVRSQRFQTNV